VLLLLSGSSTVVTTVVQVHIASSVQLLIAFPCCMRFTHLVPTVMQFFTAYILKATGELVY
jgi:hypothetical protein